MKQIGSKKSNNLLKKTINCNTYITKNRIIEKKLEKRSSKPANKTLLEKLFVVDIAVVVLEELCGVLSRATHQLVLSARMVLHVLGHVVHLASDAQPTVVGLVVLA